MHVQRGYHVHSRVNGTLWIWVGQMLLPSLNILTTSWTCHSATQTSDITSSSHGCAGGTLASVFNPIPSGCLVLSFLAGLRTCQGLLSIPGTLVFCPVPSSCA